MTVNLKSLVRRTYAAGTPLQKWLAWLCVILTFCLLIKFGLNLETSAIVDSTATVIESEIDSKWTPEEIRRHYLLPYDPDKPTNYTSANDKRELAMVSAVAERLGFKLNGFFVECGANDGIFLSNTLLLERAYNWTGLLIEADPVPAAILKERNRHAWVADVCLATQPHPMKVGMHAHKDWAGMSFIPNKVVGRRYKASYSRKFTVQCFPLEMLMTAIDRNEIDYLSLDVEGVELDILKTIPFHRITIRLISVEVRSTNKNLIKKFLESVGYKRVEEIVSGTGYLHDDLYELQTADMTN